MVTFAKIHIFIRIVEVKSFLNGSASGVLKSAILTDVILYKNTLSARHFKIRVISVYNEASFLLNSSTSRQKLSSEQTLSSISASEEKLCVSFTEIMNWSTH